VVVDRLVEADRTTELGAAVHDPDRRPRSLGWSTGIAQSLIGILTHNRRQVTVGLHLLLGVKEPELQAARSRVHDQ
jgi:hypothetical protein